MANDTPLTPADRQYLASNNFSLSALEVQKQREAMAKAEEAFTKGKAAREALDARLKARDLQKQADAAKATAKAAAGAVAGTVTASAVTQRALSNWSRKDDRKETKEDPTARTLKNWSRK